MENTFENTETAQSVPDTEPAGGGAAPPAEMSPQEDARGEEQPGAAEETQPDGSPAGGPEQDAPPFAAGEDGSARRASSPSDEELTRREAQRLIVQAQTIRQLTGVDVFSRYAADPAVRSRVLSGEWDFRDVLLEAFPSAGEPDAMPPVVRSANGGTAGIHVRGMSEGQFRRFDEALARGEVIDMR